MPSNIRYRADWTSQDGDLYRIDLIDIDYNDVTNSLEIGMDNQDGFTLDYSGENAGRYNPVLTSECVINCVAEDATFETFIDDIIGAQEQRFFMVIYLHDGGDYELFWVGLVLQGLINIEDTALPYPFQLHAADGLGRLKDIDYPAVLDEDQTFIDYLITILGETDLLQFWGGGDILLATGVNWYESSQFTTTPAASLDPLAVSRVLNNTFMILNEFNDEEALSCYDVLLQMCIRWHATLVQSAGIFYFVQTNQLYPNTFTLRNYGKTGSFAFTTAAADWKVTSINFDRTGSFMFLPSLKTVAVKYNFKQSVNSTNMLYPQTDYSTPVGFGNVQGGSAETIIFSGTVRCYLDVGAYTFTQMHAWVFDMRIQVGSKYFTNINGYPEWSNTSTDRYTILSPWWYMPGGSGNYNNNFNIAIETLPVPASGTGTFEFDFIELQDSTGATLSLPEGATINHICWVFSLRQNIDGTMEAGTEEHTSTNEDGASNPVDSSSHLQLPDLLTGDGPKDFSDGRIQILTTAPAWENSNEEWIDGGDVTGGININALLCEEAVAGQKAPIRVYSGTVIGNGMIVLPTTVLIIDSKKYVLRSGQFNANTNTWGGDWVQIHIDRTNITTLRDTTIPENYYITAGVGGTLWWQQEQFNRLLKTSHLNGHTTLLTGNYTVTEADSVIYANPGGGGLTITLPVYATSAFRSIVIINVSAANTLTVARENVGNKINEAAGDYTLAADSSINIHNSAIASIGWATLFKSARK